MFRNPRRAGARYVVTLLSALAGALLPVSRADDYDASVSAAYAYAPVAGMENVVHMSAFTVTEGVLEQSETGLLQTRRNGGTVSDAIGSAQFSRLAASDAAEVMSKVTGASVVDGKYVLIRGLGDRYANTLMNGIAIPSADPDRRAVQLDQFPAELLESIVTTKSFTPDQPGAFSGGSINLRTKSFPEQRFFSATLGVEYNSATTGEDLLRSDGLNAAPDLPGNLPSRTEAEIAARRGDFGPAEVLDRATKSFGSGVLFPGSRKAPLDSGFGIAFGGRHAFGTSGIFGYTASVTAKRDFTHSEGGAANRFIGTADAVQSKLLLTDDPGLLSFDPLNVPAGTPAFGVTRSTETETFGTFVKLALQPVEEHEVSLDLYFTETSDDTVRRGVGEEANNYAGNIFEVYDLLLTERSVASAQLSGRSTFPAFGELQVDWRAGLSNTTQDQPDYRTLSAIYDFNGRFINATGVQPNRYFRELEEDARELAVDVTYPWFAASGLDRSLKVGGLLSRNERTYEEQRFQYQGNPQNRSELETYPTPVGIISRDDDRVTFGRVISRLQEPNNYAGEQDLQAVYAMADAEVTERVRVLAGARYENTVIETVPVRALGLNPRNGEIDDGELLPAASVVFASSPKTNWRLAYGRTLARPTFKELSDIRYEDVFTGDVYIGNPDLRMSVIDNLDARWEWFPRKGETVAISVFYKSIDRPIEVLFQPGVGSIQPQNVEEGTVYGAEFEFRRNLAFLGESFSDLSFGANLALIHSEVSIPASELTLLRSFDPAAGDKRDLLGQSPYVFNTDLTWAQPSWGTVATLSFNVVGERLSLVNHGPLPDVYEQPAPLLNLVVSQPLGHRWRVKFAARNLLDPQHEQTIDASDGERIWARHRVGRSFSVSLTYFFE